MDLIATQGEELKWKRKKPDRALYNLVALIIHKMASDKHNTEFDTQLDQDTE